MRVALFGGSFNPPHVGHQSIVEWLVYQSPIRFDEVWLLPTVNHAFSKDLLPYEVRESMVSTLVEDVLEFRPGVPPSSLHIVRREEQYTVDTLRSLRAEHPETTFYLIVGCDVLHDAHRWKEWDEVCKLAQIIAVGRKGYTPVPGYDTYEINCDLAVSSSSIRKRIMDGSLHRYNSNGEISWQVWDIITALGLYEYMGVRLKEHA